MKKGFIILLLLTSLLASACSGIIGQESVGLEEFPLRLVTETVTTEPAEPSPTQKERTETGSAEQTQRGLPSECTLVSSSTKTAQNDLFSITENDWVLGPEDAAVTLIEYADFQ